MNIVLRVAGAALLILTSACSTVLEGPTQTIAVDSLPSGADCLIKDNDLVLGKVHTPGTADIAKSKNDILVECTKEGYIPNKQRNRSDVAISSMGNMVLGQWSFVGNMVDSASGASHKYDSKVLMVMNELPPVAQTAAGALPERASSLASQPVTTLAGLPPEQLALQLSTLLNSSNVVVSHQSPDEVIREIANHQPIMGDTPGTQEIAGLAGEPMPIQHSAE